MGRVKDWIIEMEEDALCMTQEEWCSKYGSDLIEVFIEAQINAVMEELNEED
mgnify:CR=1 FL=1